MKKDFIYYCSVDIALIMLLTNFSIILDLKQRLSYVINYIYK